MFKSHAVLVIFALGAFILLSESAFIVPETEQVPTEW